jgi:ubiquinone/menaquinone biosynthesis C-methylase UbiE
MNKYNAMFSGVIGKEYDTLMLICPAATEMSRLVGETVASIPDTGTQLQLVEIGGGTGITTLSVLTARDNLQVLSIDSEPVMQEQAKQSLKAWVDQGRLSFCSDDALTALQQIKTRSVDIVASVYTTHNFLHDYRAQVIKEIYRILKTDGHFINGDRYALDDISAHTRIIQDELRQYFNALIPLNRFQVLEDWVIHLFCDESENRVMRETIALEQLENVGFRAIKLSDRIGASALVTAIKK